MSSNFSDIIKKYKEIQAENEQLDKIYKLADEIRGFKWVKLDNVKTNCLMDTDTRTVYHSYTNGGCHCGIGHGTAFIEANVYGNSNISEDEVNLRNSAIKIANIC